MNTSAALVPSTFTIGTKSRCSNSDRFNTLFDPNEYHKEDNESIFDIGIPIDEDESMEFKFDGQDNHFADQFYESLIVKLRKGNKLFVDPAFPPNDSSIFTELHNRRSFVQWTRASELSMNPKFIQEGATRFDINQGRLGDCWFLAAVGNLTLKPKLFQNVVQIDQNFEDSQGMFRFRFYRFGEWVEVVVDDYLPTLNGELIFMKSNSPNEYWSSLLEKAYAKLNGCYQALSGGLINEAMVDFTGGCPEHYDLINGDQIPGDMFRIMQKAMKRNSLMGAGIMPNQNVYENKLDNGLVQGHAYSVTSLTTVTPFNQKVDLIRIRNPWGNFMEWRGPWSDHSKEWETLSKEDQERLNHEKDDDGEFYICKEDFFSNFDFLEVCHLTEDSLDDKDIASGKLFWYKQEFHGTWEIGKTAGGSANDFRSFIQNPQFRLILTDKDSDSEGENEDVCTVIVSLMQKSYKRSGLVSIGFVIYEVSQDKDLPLRMQDLKSLPIVGFTQHYYNFREINRRLKLKEGHYVIIPTTFDPDIPGEFLLRVFSEKSSELQGSEDYIPKSKPVLFNFV